MRRRSAKQKQTATNNVTQIFKNNVEFVGNKTTTHGIIWVFCFFNWKFAEMLNLVTTSVNTIECFGKIQLSMPTSAVCLSTMERSSTQITHNTLRRATTDNRMTAKWMSVSAVIKQSAYDCKGVSQDYTSSEVRKLQILPGTISKN